MNPAVIFRREAEEDVQEIYRWYESQQAGLGEEFLDILQEKLEMVRIRPEMYAVIYKSTRRIILSKFPYLVFYISTGEQIVVLAVLHAFRDPAHWPRQ